MSYTGKYLNFFSEGFASIRDFAFSPCNWAVKDSCDSSIDTSDSNAAGEVIECGICLMCNCIACCCKTPVACAASAVTLPLAGSTALIFGALGLVGLPFVAVADGVNACATHCSTADNAEIQSEKPKASIQTDDPEQEEKKDTPDEDSPSASPRP